MATIHYHLLSKGNRSANHFDTLEEANVMAEICGCEVEAVECGAEVKAKFAKLDAGLALCDKVLGRELEPIVSDFNPRTYQTSGLHTDTLGADYDDL